jgi:hypothetical protein
VGDRHREEVLHRPALALAGDRQGSDDDEGEGEQRADQPGTML